LSLSLIWAGLKNGELLRTAEDNGIDVFLTRDGTLSYEQNLTGRHLAIVALSAIQLPIIKLHLTEIIAALAAAAPRCRARFFSERRLRYVQPKEAGRQLTKGQRGSVDHGRDADIAAGDLTGPEAGHIRVHIGEPARTIGKGTFL
jgi:hypothetical protein